MEIKAEYLKFESYDDMLKFENELLALPVNEAEKKIQGFVALKSTWDNLFLQFSSGQYDYAEKNGPQSIGKHDNEYFEYISLKDYKDYLQSMSKYTSLVSSFPLFDASDLTPHTTEERLNMIRTITGFDKIQDLYNNYIKINDLSDPIKAFETIKDAFLFHINYGEDPQSIESEVYTDNLKKLNDSANMLFNSGYSQDSLKTLKSKLEELNRRINNRQFGNDFSSFIQEFVYIEDSIKQANPSQEYTIVRDTEKEKEISDKKEEAEKKEQEARKKRELVELPKAIKEEQDKLLNLKLQISSLEGTISNSNDPGERAKLYNQVSKLMNEVGTIEEQLGRHQNEYNCLLPTATPKRPNNQQFEENIGEGRIAEGTTKADGNGLIQPLTPKSPSEHKIN